MRDEIKSALITAMKAKDATRVGALRLMQAAIKDRDIEARGQGKGEATHEELLALLQKMVKQRRESLDIYTKNNRPELAQKEADEITVIEGFLPKAMNEEEVSQAIDVALRETGATSMKDMGLVMANLKSKFAGQMDFSAANALIKTKLSG